MNITNIQSCINIMKNKLTNNMEDEVFADYFLIYIERILVKNIASIMI